MISGSSLISQTLTGTWNEKGELEKNPEEGGWQEWAGASALLEQGWISSRTFRETKADFRQPVVRWTNELGRVRGGPCDL